MSDHLPVVTVIVVNWNARDMLARCLTALRDGDGKDATGLIEVIVVDNASTDDSVAMLQQRFPDVKLIANAANRGFAGANNQAAAVARGAYLLLLNPDAEVTPRALGRLVAYADEHDRIGAIGPRLVNPDGTTQRSCWRGYPGLGAALVDALYLWKLPWLPLANRSEYAPEELRTTRDVDHLLGACMFIPRAAWETVGPLDEDYFLFLEETDWCRRANEKGLRVVYLPGAVVLHHGQHSMRQQPARNLPHLYRSTCRFYRRSPSSSRLGLIVLKGIMALAIGIRFVLWSVRRATAGRDDRDHARSMMHGYRQALQELPSM